MFIAVTWGIFSSLWEDCSPGSGGSEKRAEAVKTCLISKGISADRLMTVGHGTEMPTEDNGTAAGKAKNRRVEFKLSQ